MESTTKKNWEHFSHGADVGVRGIGKNVEEAFEMGAQALTMIVAEEHEIKSTESLEIQCHAPNLEILFFDWINAVIYEMDTRHMVFGSYDIHIHENDLKAKISGEPLDLAKHSSTVEPKGATMTELKVEKKGDSWIAQCIVDV